MRVLIGLLAGFSVMRVAIFVAAFSVLSAANAYAQVGNDHP